MAPGMVYTLHRRAGDAGAADLGAIRRSDAIIDLLAGRRLLRPRGLHDPAIALLSALAADVDSLAGEDAAGPGAVPASRVVAAGTGRPPAGRHQPQRTVQPQRALERQFAAATWSRAAAAVAVAATVAGAAATGVLVTGMLARLARTGAGQSGALWGGAGARPARGFPAARPTLSVTRRRPL